ncbi:hypothetical protein GIB67_020289 [Kingdonia uniflora]|uniref:DCD domain-containing protein n=1 Tax=Kingdonia uniflora TaxID=39325 RepID=A0A7J7P3S4_9MAGN|nr:hypothetical protein GIB67_020289 [Kingdonia uniflora]
MGRRSKKQVLALLGKQSQYSRSVSGDVMVRRKKQNLTLGEPAQISHSINGSISARNLPKKQLSGMIFGCTNNTIKECLRDELFGLPDNHYSYVRNITPGLPVFLFNYSDRKLHGIFVAITHGQMNINPHGWTKDGSAKTPYPAQVRVRVRRHCESLAEESYKEIIQDNYLGNSSHFWFELDQLQTGRLVALFKSVRVRSYFVANPCDIPTHRTLPSPPPCNDTKSRYEDAEPAPKKDFSCSDRFYIQPGLPQTEPKWADLFKADSKLDARVEDISVSESTVSGFNDFITEPGTSHGTPCLDADYIPLEPKWLAELVTEEKETEEEHVFAKLKQLTFGSDQLYPRSLHQIEDVSTPEHWEDMCYSDAPKVSMKYTDDSIHLFDHQPATYLARQEMDAITALLFEQISRTAALEKKQAESDALLKALQAVSNTRRKAFQDESYKRYEAFQVELDIRRKVFQVETDTCHKVFQAESDAHFSAFQAESDTNLKAFQTNSDKFLKQLKDRYEKKIQEQNHRFEKEFEELKGRVEILEFLLSKKPEDHLEKEIEEPKDRRGTRQWRVWISINNSIWKHVIFILVLSEPETLYKLEMSFSKLYLLIFSSYSRYISSWKAIPLDTISSLLPFRMQGERLGTVALRDDYCDNSYNVMPGSRKKKNQILISREEPTCHSTVNGSVKARNLMMTSLGGVIFGCTHNTLNECLTKRIFGLPAGHFSYVQNIKPGLPLFLFNYIDRKLHGVFEAASNGQMNINPYGWSEDGSERTQFPAQDTTMLEISREREGIFLTLWCLLSKVRVCRRMECQSLTENKYKEIISKNYYDHDRPHYFYFELDHEQTSRLLSLFKSVPVRNSIAVPLLQTRNMLPSNKAIRVGEVSRPSATKEDFRFSGHFYINSGLPQTAVKWAGLFKAAPDLNTGIDDEAISETDFSSGSHSIAEVELETACKWANLFKGDSCLNTGVEDETTSETDIETDISSGVHSITEVEPLGDFEADQTPNTYGEAILETGFSSGNHANAEVMPLGGTTSLNEEESFWETKIVGEEVKNEEHVSFKLRQLDFERDQSKSCQEGAIEDISLSCGTQITAEFSWETESFNEEVKLVGLMRDQTNVCPTDNIEDTPLHLDVEYYEDFPAVEEMREDISDPSDPIYDVSYYPAARAVQKEKYEHLYDNTSVIDQLRQDIEDVKAYAAEQLSEETKLKKKLADSERQVQQLLARVQLLESRSTRSMTCVDELIFFMGGYDGSTWLPSLESYSPSRDFMKSYKPMSSSCAYASATVLNADIYIFGGGNGVNPDVWYDTAEVYSSSTNNWTELSPLVQKKGGLAGATLHDKIYAVGGGNGAECFSEVEMFDLALGCWISMPSMSEKRFALAVAELNGALYAVGGFDGHTYLKSAERFDPRERNSWSMLEGMKTSRGSHSLAVLNEKLYAIGGYDGKEMVPSVEIFDPRMGSWIAGDNMKLARGYSAAAVIGEALYVVGGLGEGRIVVETVERMAKVGKKQTLTLEERPRYTPSVSNAVRNLARENLGGVIFGCTHDTLKECLSKRIFGLPGSHFLYVQYIKLGLPLFLFNYSNRKLHGVFEAASNGHMNINPNGWSGKGSEKTRYPAQVRVCRWIECEPLAEKRYKKIIQDNYYEEPRFWFELDQSQTGRLINLFKSVSVTSSIARPLCPTIQAPLSSNANACGDKKLKLSAKKEDFRYANHFYKKPGLLQSSSKISETEFSIGNHSFTKVEPLSGVISWDEDNYFLDTRKGSKEVKNEQERILLKLKQLNLERDLSKSCLKDYTEDISVPCTTQVTVDYSWETKSFSKEVGQLDLETDNSKVCPNYHNEDISIPCDAKRDIDCLAASAVLAEKCEEDSVCCGTQGTADFSWETESVGEEVEQIGIETPNLCQKDHTEHICVPHDANLAIEYHPATSADAEKKFDEESIHLYDHTSELDELRQEIEKFKALSAKQLRKTTNLEKKLADSEKHVQQLIDRVQLYESKLNPSMTCVDELVYIMGGYDGSTWLSSLESYSPSKETVRSHMPMRYIRAYASATVFNGDIYVFGGGNGVDLDVWYDSVESYNPFSNKWSILPPLIERKGGLAGAALHDKIYAVGGRNRVKYFSEVEMFDLNLGNWVSMHSMLEKLYVDAFTLFFQRFALGVAELNGALYAVGGFDGNNYLESAERIDPRENVSWSRLDNMKKSRGGHSLAVLSEKLYAVGGYNGIEMIPSVEIFDPRMGTWIPGEDMKLSRGYSASAVLGEELYVVGGLGKRHVMTDTVERYVEGRGWMTTSLKGIQKRSDLEYVEKAM